MIVGQVKKADDYERMNIFISIILCNVSLCVVNRYYENHVICQVRVKLIEVIDLY